MSKPWHEDDSFWEGAQSVMFDDTRLLMAESEVDAAERLLQLKPGQLVLDMCCGLGRHSVSLARRGYRVTGVDRTAAYLKAAAEAAARAGVTAEFVEHDARTYEGSGFDAAINLYTSFGYFEDPKDDERLLQVLHRALKPGGRLLIQVAGKEVLAKGFTPRTWFEHDGGVLLQESRILGAFEKVETIWTWGAGTEQERRSAFAVRLYSATELSALLCWCGFEGIRILGDYDGSRYDQNAKRLVVLALKVSD